MYQKKMTALIIGLLLIGSDLHANDSAIKHFQSALSACERALQMEMPKSQGSLKILQSLSKRYQRNKQLALGKEPALKDSTTELYKGEFFEEKTFKEAFQICEAKLATKAAAAKENVAKRLEQRKNEQQTQQEVVSDLMKKMEMANQQVKVAIEENCVVYLQMLNEMDAEEKTPPAKEKVASLHKNYQTAKQKALEIYPDIVKQFQTVVIPDPLEKKKENRTIHGWFNRCEEAFAEQLTEKTAEETEEKIPEFADEVGPRNPRDVIKPEIDQEASAPPPSETEVPSGEEEEASEIEEVKKSAVKPLESQQSAKHSTEPVDPEEVEEPAVSVPQPVEKKKAAVKPVANPPPEEEISPEEKVSPEPAVSKATEEDTDSEAVPPEDEDREYQTAVEKLQGDRLKILKENKRLPDFVDDENFDLQKAKAWQFKNEDKCKTYRFKGNKSVGEKATTGECPEF